MGPTLNQQAYNCVHVMYANKAEALYPLDPLTFIQENEKMFTLVI